MARKIRSSQEKKALNNKIAEIIWLSLAGLILFVGVITGIMHLIIVNIGGNQTKSAFYFLIQFEESFINWVKSWWTDFAFNNFGSISIVFLIAGLLFLLLILLIFSNRVDSIDKKDKAKLQREANRKRFEEALLKQESEAAPVAEADAIEEAPVQSPTEEN